MSTSVVLQQMGVITILVAIGIILYKKKIVDDYTSPKLSAIVMDVCNPALILALYGTCCPGLYFPLYSKSR